MLPLKPRGRSQVVGRWCRFNPSNHHFHYAPRFATSILAPVSDSLVRVSRRGIEHHFLSPGIPQSVYCPPGYDDDEHAKCTNQLPLKKLATCTYANTDDLRFPLSNFRHSLTLFSKLFSSFLHSTCSLSVSHLYLALDGIYHPL